MNRQFVQSNCFFLVFKQCPFLTQTRQFSPVTGRKLRNQCVKRNLVLPISKSMLLYRSLPKDYIQPVAKVAWYYRQQLKYGVASDCSVIMSDKQSKDTCNLNCPSGAAIWIPDIWIFYIKMSLSVNSFPWWQNTIKLLIFSFRKLVIRG